ncbi:MAG: aspartyl-tRNA(Asn)/glutamyl-tRNA(Gln) amidotransferase subunit A [Chloroflexi bacterium]|jgi:aspartyl-tRNA(Asn)/glutamyl-tRNA(Gln) amidotransferase subunit A|nr:MAG: aspartyl-tRNA(Asn)/glutamyl-tRNA(Gln) amidotransferase subunit A [Chloroflexota bacterium]
MHPRNLTISEAAEAIAKKDLSPVTLMKSFLERIRELEPSLKAWITLTEESALQSAKDAEIEIARNGSKGYLHGIPIGAKDIYYTKGVLTTAGAPQYSSFVPDWDATSIAKLKRSGAIIIGKTVTTQFAASDPSITYNPWNLLHTPGGSSSGSAVAVATRMCSAALGSQTGGSTLRPAIYNGVVGLKPTYGRISRHGVIPFSWSLDTVGIIARTTKDSAILLQSMAGHDPYDDSSSLQPVDNYLSRLEKTSKPPKIGVIREFFYENSSKEIQEKTDASLDSLKAAGAKVKEISLPKSYYIHESARSVVMNVDAAAFHKNMYEKNPNDYGPHLRKIIEVGMLIPGEPYLQAQRVRTQFRKDATALLDDVDILLTPATPTAAPKDRSTTGNPVFQASWTSAGLPSIGIPCGTDSEGMPIGIQLISSPFAESDLLEAAQWCESVLDINLTPPSLDN